MKNVNKGLFLRKERNAQGVKMDGDLRTFKQFLSEWRRHIGEYWEMYPIEIKYNHKLNLKRFPQYGATIEIGDNFKITDCDLIDVSQEKDGTVMFRIVYPITEDQPPIWGIDGYGISMGAMNTRKINY